MCLEQDIAIVINTVNVGREDIAYMLLVRARPKLIAAALCGVKQIGGVTLGGVGSVENNSAAGNTVAGSRSVRGEGEITCRKGDVGSAEGNGSSAVEKNTVCGIASVKCSAAEAQEAICHYSATKAVKCHICGAGDRQGRTVCIAVEISGSRGAAVGKGVGSARKLDLLCTGVLKRVFYAGGGF